MGLGTLDGLLAYVHAQRAESHAHTDFHHTAPVVTIAGDHGAGGSEVGAVLAGRLGVACFDKALLDSVVSEMKSDPALLRRLDDERPPRPGTGLYAAFLGIADPLYEYRRLMARVLNGIAQRGGVVIGRGAHLLIHGEPLLRVRLLGSPEVCAARLLAGTAGASDPSAIEAMKAEVAAVNAEKAAFLRSCFGTDRNDPAQYDLIVNTDRFADMAPVATILLTALDSAGRSPLRASAAKGMAA